MIVPNGILMIEPKGAVTSVPIIDELTKKMTAAWRNSTSGPAWRGVHICTCGVRSDNRDHFVNGVLTNSLCVHYVAFHRSDVPQDELEKVAQLNYGELEPTADELKAPNTKPHQLNNWR